MTNKRKYEDDCEADINFEELSLPTSISSNCSFLKTNSTNESFYDEISKAIRERDLTKLNSSSESELNLLNQYSYKKDVPSPVDIAIENGNDELAICFIDKSGYKNVDIATKYEYDYDEDDSKYDNDDWIYSILNKSVIIASQYERIDVLKHLMKKKIPIGLDYTLATVILTGSYEKVKTIIDSGNCFDDLYDYEIILENVINSDNIDMIKLVCEKVVHSNMYDMAQQGLLLASNKTNIEAVQFFINKLKKTQSKSSWLNLAVANAVRNGHIEILNCLLDAEANGMIAFAEAIYQNNQYLKDYLLSLKIKNKFIQSEFFNAIAKITKTATIEDAQLFLDFCKETSSESSQNHDNSNNSNSTATTTNASATTNTTVNATTTTATTTTTTTTSNPLHQKLIDEALFFFAVADRIEIVQWLMTLNPSSLEIENALCESAKKGYTDMVRLLIKSDLKDMDMNEVLEESCHSGKLEIVQMIYEHLCQ